MNKEHSIRESPSVYSIGSATNLVAVKSRNTYFQRKRSKNTLILLGLSVLAIALLVGLIVLGFFYLRATRVTYCDTEDCIRIVAASLKESMDTSISPCEDFYHCVLTMRPYTYDPAPVDPPNMTQYLYRYVCGRWSEHHPTPDTNMMYSWFNERTDRITWKLRELLRTNSSQEEPWAVEQAKIFYQSCVNTRQMDAQGLSPLLEALKKFNLPQIPAALGSKDGNFVVKMAKIRRFLGKDIIIGVDVVPDPRNRSRNVIVLDIPSSSSPLPGDKDVEMRLKALRTDMSMRKARGDDNEDDLDSPTIVEKNYIIAVMREVISNGTISACGDGDLSPEREEEIKKLADRIYDLVGQLYYMSHVNKNLTLTDADIDESHYLSLQELQYRTDMSVIVSNAAMHPVEVWLPFIFEVFKDIDGLDSYRYENKILVTNFEYLKDVAIFLSTTTEEMLETLIWWTLIDVMAPHSSSNLRDIWTDYINKLVSVENTDPRSLHCAEVVDYMMGMAVSWLFIDPKWHQKIDSNMAEMVEHIRSAFSSLVGNIPWMDQRTKLRTLEKAKKMTYAIGHPDWLFDECALNGYYDKMDLKDDAYLKNMLMLASLASHTEIKSIDQGNYMNETYWGADPTEVNAVYTILANHITKQTVYLDAAVPAGILQFPFYQLGLEALNYGAIGTILGHELTHGFDNSGRLYDGNGNIQQWWTDDTIQEFQDKVECFIKHYGGYYEKEVDRHVDGELTLDENIADNGGLREAVHAYRRWTAEHGQEVFLPGFGHLTHEQLVFLGFAHLWCESYTPESLRWMLQDSHSPGHVRLRAVLRNSQEFSDAWQCPAGSPMNPSEKCRIW